MKCSILVLCLALAVANGQFFSSLSNWVDANRDLMASGVDMGTGAAQGLAGMKQGAASTIANAGRGGVNVAHDVASTMIGANLGAAAQLADRNVPVVGGVMSGALNMVNSMEQMKINGIAQAMKIPFAVVENVVGLEVGAFNRMMDAVNSFMKLNLNLGAGVMKTMISMASGMTNIPGQMTRVASIMMRNMPVKIMNLAMNIRKDILPSMKNIIEDMRKAGEEIYKNIKDEVAKFTGPEFQAKLGEMKSALDDMMHNVTGGVDKAMKVLSEMGLSESQLAAARGVLENMSTAFSEVEGLREAVTKGMEHVHEVVEEMKNTLNSEQFQQLTDELNSFIPRLMDGSANVKDFVDKVVAAIPSLEGRKEELTSALQSLEDLAVKVRNQLKTVMDQVNKLMPSLGDMMKQLRANMEEAMKTLGGAAGMAGGLAGGMAGGLGGGMSLGMSGGLSGGMSANTAGLVNNAAAMAGNAANIAGSTLAMGGNALGMAGNVAGLASGAARGVLGSASRFSIWG